MLASILLAACAVPERLHLTAVGGYGAQAPAIALRVKREGFAAVAKSLPRDDPTVGVSDRGWISRDDLAQVGVPATALTKVGATAEVEPGSPIVSFVHVDEIRPAGTCDAVIAQYPDDATALLTRAETRRAAGDLGGASADYAALVRSDPKSYYGHYGLATVHYSERDFTRALADVDAALSGNVAGAGADAYALKAMIEEARGDDDLATADAAFAIAQYHGRMQDDSQARYVLGLAYAHLGYYEAATEEFDAAVTAHPAYSYPYISRAFAWFARGDVAKAKSDLLAATNAEPKFSQAFVDVAMLDFATGDATGALGAAQHALLLNAHDPYAALWLLLASRALHRAPALPNADALASDSPWPAAAIRVFLERAPASGLVAAAASPDPFTASTQLCEARFYGAAYRLSGGDKAGALPALRQAASECPFREHERVAAQQLLRSAQP